MDESGHRVLRSKCFPLESHNIIVSAEMFLIGLDLSLITSGTAGLDSSSLNPTNMLLVGMLYVATVGLSSVGGSVIDVDGLLSLTKIGVSSAMGC